MLLISGKANMCDQGVSAMDSDPIEYTQPVPYTQPGNYPTPDQYKQPEVQFTQPQPAPQMQQPAPQMQQRMSSAKHLPCGSQCTTFPVFIMCRNPREPLVRTLLGVLYS